MGDRMQFPQKWEQFLRDYEFKDSEGFYTNGSMLIPSFRVKQMMKHYLPKRGRWVMKETMIRSPYAKNAYCSECLEETSYAHNFCPNCGAKMDGERKGDDAD